MNCIDASDAPPGCMAAVPLVGGEDDESCTGCVFRGGESQCNLAQEHRAKYPCTDSNRKDGCWVIFVHGQGLKPVAMMPRGARHL